MADKKPNDGVDVTKAWAATQGQQSSATRLRIFSLICWAIAIAGEGVGIYFLKQHKFDAGAGGGNLPLLVGLLVGIAVFAIAGNLMGWKEEEKLSRIVDHAELKKNDYNLSPSRYNHTSDAETYRPIAEIVEELKVIETEARETDKALKEILEKIGI